MRVKIVKHLLYRPVKDSRWYIRLWKKAFSDQTFNKVVLFNFRVGQLLYFYPISKPEIVKDDLGYRVVLYPYHTLAHTIVNFLSLLGLYFYCGFEILQMVRFFPIDGFTRRTVSVLFYFNMTLLSSIMITTYWMHNSLLVQGWNWIEITTGYFMRNGCADAWKWKRDFGTFIFVISIISITYSAALVMIAFFMIKPNNTAHIFYLLPEAWKPYTISYIVMCLWQTFLVAATIIYINAIAVIGIGFVYFSKHCIESVVRNDFTRPDGIKVGTRIQMMRHLTILNKMANEAVAHFFIPTLTFFVLVTGVFFTYIAITRYGDPNIDLELYALIVIIDVAVLIIVTAVFTEAGKYEDASLKMIISARASLNEKTALESGRVALYRRYIMCFTSYGVNVGCFARLNDETTKLMHETIIDNLMLLLNS